MKRFRVLLFGLASLLALSSCNLGTGLQQQKFSVTIVPSPYGNISLSPSKTQYLDGDSVTVTATPKSGYKFSNWTSGLSGTTNPSNLKVTSDMSISASFVPQTFSLWLNAGVGGSISVYPSKQSYNSGDVVTLTAVANNGYQFNSWGGRA
jgi:hypothetical protein